MKPAAVAPPTNEHKAAFDLRKGMLLQGRIIAADAMFCHRDCVQAIRDQGGQYFVAVKDNQKPLKRAIASAFEPAFSPRGEAKRRLEEDDTARTTGRYGGRLATRTLQATTRRNGYLDGPDVGQVCRLERVVKRDGKETTEVAYALPRAGPACADAGQLRAWRRGHGGIENRVPWGRDVTLGEDRSRRRTASAPEALAGLRNAALRFLRLSGLANIAEALRENLYHVRDLLAKLGLVNL